MALASTVVRLVIVAAVVASATYVWASTGNAIPDALPIFAGIALVGGIVANTGWSVPAIPLAMVAGARLYTSTHPGLSCADCLPPVVNPVELMTYLLFPIGFIAAGFGTLLGRVGMLIYRKFHPGW